MRAPLRPLGNIMRTLLVTTIALLSMSAAQSHAAPGPHLGFDFDAPMASLHLAIDHVDGNLDDSGKPNGLLDADELALVAEVLNNMTLDLRRSGGVTHEAVIAAFVRAELKARSDLAPLASTWPQAPRVAAGYAMLGEGSFRAFAAMTEAFGAPLASDYEQAATLGRFFGPEGDADGDGVTNHDEYNATIGQGRAAYLAAALDPTIRPAARPETAESAAPARSTIGLPRSPGVEALNTVTGIVPGTSPPRARPLALAAAGHSPRTPEGARR